MMGVTARAQAVVKYGEPMQIVETKIPPLSGTQVLIKNTYVSLESILNERHSGVAATLYF